MYDTFRYDLIDRANIYGIGLNALECLCQNGVPKGKEIPRDYHKDYYLLFC
jgi:hypothetical protein